LDDDDGQPCMQWHTNTTALFGFKYDSAGNLIEQRDSVAQVSITGTYAVGNRQQSWGTDTAGYDLDGNVTVRNGTTLVWSADGFLTSVGSVNYDYNALGQLVRRRQGSTPDRHFLWEGDQLLAELDGTATSRIGEYVYEPGTDRPVALLTGPQTWSTTRYLHQDELGNVLGATNNSNAVVQQLEYSPWGTVTTLVNQLADTNRLQWKGLMFEGGTTNLFYARHRWYDPEARRFLSEDPIGIDGGLNLYAFGGNDPVNFGDPDGLDRCTQAQLAGGFEEIAYLDDEGTSHYTCKQPMKISVGALGDGGFDWGFVLRVLGAWLRATAAGYSSAINGENPPTGGGTGWLAGQTSMAVGLRAPLGKAAMGLLETASSVTGLTSKAAAREALRRLNITGPQISAARSALSRGTKSSSYDLISNANGDLLVNIYRAGHDGFQVMQSVISPNGAKGVFQYGVNAAGKVFVDPKYIP
jgi:RHS repeat-associated protein